MRYTTQQLYKIDPKTFIGRPYDEVLVEKLNALIKRHEGHASLLRTSYKDPLVEYEYISAINDELKYIEGAIIDHKKLLDEMGINHAR